MSFEVGDLVVARICADCEHLAVDEIYTVKDMFSDCQFIQLQDVPGSYDSRRFISLEQYHAIQQSSNLQSGSNSADKGQGGMKFDGDKPRMALLVDGCPNALEAVASVLTFGAQKYEADSWKGVPNGAERYKSALLRHLTAVGKGEVLDSESGLHHLAHAACNALFILELALRGECE